jgi:hypothetical protein
LVRFGFSSYLLEIKEFGDALLSEYRVAPIHSREMKSKGACESAGLRKAKVARR